MAVMVRLSIVSATRAQHDACDDKVGERLARLGGPPAGLMFHVTYPDDDGFTMVDVWREEAEGRQFFETVVQPAVAEVGVEAGELTVRPVWGMARP